MKKLLDLFYNHMDTKKLGIPQFVQTPLTAEDLDARDNTITSLREENRQIRRRLEEETGRLEGRLQDTIEQVQAEQAQANTRIALLQAEKMQLQEHKTQLQTDKDEANTTTVRLQAELDALRAATPTPRENSNTSGGGCQRKRSRITEGQDSPSKKRRL